MARGRPYVFCRYQIAVDGEPLGGIGQKQLFSESQGRLFEHGAARRDREAPTALLMEPKSHDFDGEQLLTWSVGIRPGYRIRVDYDRAAEQKTHTVVPDPHIKYADLVALPDSGLLAIEDRSGEEHISAKQAISVMRTLSFNLSRDGIGSFSVNHVAEEDVQRWLSEWDLTEYSYSIAPLNPISAKHLGEMRSDAMKADGVGSDQGRMKPPEGQFMRVQGGVVQQVHELAEVGYGQEGFRGVTPDGHEAHVPKPKFHPDRHKNFKEREKPYFVRVVFMPPEDEDDLNEEIAVALKRFYRG